MIFWICVEKNGEVVFQEAVFNLQMNINSNQMFWFRFTEIMSQVLKPPKSYSLMFLLPLITRSLLKQQTSKEPGLISCSIEVSQYINRHPVAVRGQEAMGTVVKTVRM